VIVVVVVGKVGFETRSGPRGKRDMGSGFAGSCCCTLTVCFFFACVLRGVKDVVVTTFGGGVSVFSSAIISPLFSTLGSSGSRGLGTPFVAGFDLFGGGNMANNPPPPPCPFGLSRFFETSSSSPSRG